MSQLREIALKSKFLSGLPSEVLDRVFAVTAQLAGPLGEWMARYPSLMRPGRAPQIGLTLAAADPFCDVQVMQSCARLIAWIFAVDDVLDEEKENIHAAWARVEQCLPLLRGAGETSGGAEPLCQSLLEIRKDLECLPCFSAVQSAWADSLEQMLAAMQNELRWSERYREHFGRYHGESKAPPPLPRPEYAAYLETGRRSISVAPVFLSALMAMGEQDVPARPDEFSALVQEVATCIRLANDLRSYEKEVAEGKPNAVTLLLHEGMRTGEELGKEAALEKARASVQERIQFGLKQCEMLARARHTPPGRPELFLLRLAGFACDFYVHHDYDHSPPRAHGWDPDGSASHQRVLNLEKGMTRAVEVVLADLRSLIAELGRNGGLQNGSVYDTAQVVRLAPPEEGVDAALEWLLAQQHADGGWDNPRVLRARDTPTLAAVLALHARGQGERARTAVQRGLAFLRAQAPYWTELPDDLLVGVELTLPRLLEDAVALRVDVPVEQYAALIEMGRRRREKLSRMKIVPGTPPVHSWEGWGTEPDPALLDASGGVGLSPAATAAWVHAAAGRPELAQAVASARRYLKNAEKGTDIGLPGVVPPSWPINWMEQQWGLFALLCAGLLNHPRLADVVTPHLDALSSALTPRGIGFTDHFMADGDCTGVTVALLAAAGRSVDATVLDQYAREDHFNTYPGESNPSLTTTAHVVMALNIVGKDTSRWRQAMIRKQTADGRWLLDKWQTSWLYTTTQVMFALSESAALRSSVDALLRHQQEDGGWGAGERTTRVETAMAVLALRSFQGRGLAEREVNAALDRARRYLRSTYRPFLPSGEPLWIAKALYCPFRMDAAFELAAMLALEVKQS